MSDRVSEAFYLEDIIRSDGKNTSNIKERVTKGLGIISKIIDVLKSISFGAKYFEIATSLHEVYLINGMLTSAEIWYGMQEKEEQELEKVDKILL